MGRKGEFERKDHLYHEAKREGYRSRASYKLIELNKRFGFLKAGIKVLDLGAWPGGWCQVAAGKVGSQGIVVAIDLVPLDPLPFKNLQVITGDACEETILDQASLLAAGDFDLVISDMSAKLTGIRSVDQASSVGCLEIALAASDKVLRQDGTLVMKAFKGSDIDLFFKSTRPRFREMKRCELDSTRKSSNEIYFVCIGFKK